jgi:hypothetical protein
MIMSLPLGRRKVEDDLEGLKLDGVEAGEEGIGRIRLKKNNASVHLVILSTQVI